MSSKEVILKNGFILEPMITNKPRKHFNHIMEQEKYQLLHIANQGKENEAQLGKEFLDWPKFFSERQAIQFVAEAVLLEDKLMVLNVAQALAVASSSVACDRGSSQDRRKTFIQQGTAMMMMMT